MSTPPQQQKHQQQPPYTRKRKRWRCCTTSSTTSAGKSKNLRVHLWLVCLLWSGFTLMYMRFRKGLFWGDYYDFISTDEGSSTSVPLGDLPTTVSAGESHKKHHAIVVPYRNRAKHLAVFQDYMGHWLRHHYPKDQFTIWLVEQGDEEDFNRAWLGNVGIMEIIKHDPQTSCIVFHDVDLIPNQTSHVPYTTCHLPTQLGSELEHFKWGVPYATSFGGITSLSLNHWIQVNGFSNDYVGWGGEDDDLYHRIRINHLVLDGGVPTRPAKGQGVFNTISGRSTDHVQKKKHGNKDKTIAMLAEMALNSDRWQHDGLNDVYYTVTEAHTTPLLVDVGNANPSNRSSAFHSLLPPGTTIPPNPTTTNSKSTETTTTTTTTSDASTSMFKRIKVIPKKSSSTEKLDNNGKPIPALELIHIPYTGGQALTTAASRMGLVWGACYFGDYTEWECPSNATTSTTATSASSSGKWRFNMPYKASSYRQAKKPWLLPLQAFERHPYHDGADQFVVVRHPYERAISFYRHVYDEQHGYPYGYEQQQNHQHSLSYIQERENPETMNQFLITFLGSNTPPSELELPPQTLYVEIKNGEKMQRVLKYENLTTDIVELLQQYQLLDNNGGVFPMPPPTRLKDVMYLQPKDLSSTNLNLLNTRYYADFEAFDFEAQNPTMKFGDIIDTVEKEGVEREENQTATFAPFEYVPIPFSGDRDITLAASRSGFLWGACHWGQFEEYECPSGSGHLDRYPRKPLRYRLDSLEQGKTPWNIPLFQFRDAPLRTNANRFTVVRNPYSRAMEFYRHIYDQNHGYPPPGFPLNNLIEKYSEGQPLPDTTSYLAKRENAESLNNFLQQYFMSLHIPMRPIENFEMLPQTYHVFGTIGKTNRWFVHKTLHYELLEDEWEAMTEEWGLNMPTIEFDIPLFSNEDTRPIKSMGGQLLELAEWFFLGEEETRSQESIFADQYLLDIEDLNNVTIAMINDHYKIDFESLGYRMRETNVSTKNYWAEVKPPKVVKAYSHAKNFKSPMVALPLSASKKAAIIEQKQKKPVTITATTSSRAPAHRKILRVNPQ